MKKIVLKYAMVTSIILALISGLVLGITKTPGAAEQKTLKLNYQGQWGASEKQNWAAEQMKLGSIIENLTAGKVTVTLVKNIAKDEEILDAVRTRMLDIGTQGNHMRGELSLYNFTSLPFIPHDKLPVMLGKLKHLFRDLWAKDQGVILLAYNYYLPQFLYTTKPCATFDDLKSMKLRILGVELTTLFKNAGGNPINVPFAEVYQALQRGMIEGAQSAPPPYITQAWYERAKYISSWPLGGLYMSVIMNKDAFNELTPENQKNLMAAMDQFEKDQWDGVQKDVGIILKQAEDKGAKRMDPPQGDKDKLVAFVDPVIQAWKKRVGPNADAVLKVINETLGTNYK